MKEQHLLYSGTGANPNFTKLRKYATGEYLDFIEVDINALRTKGWRSSAATKIVGVVRESSSTDRVAIKSCEDNSKVRLVDRVGKDVTPDLLRRYVQTLVIVKTGDTWKVSETTSLKVESFTNQDCGAE